MTAMRLARVAQARTGRPRPQDADRHIGTRLRARRVMLGLTQQQVAELVGITYQQVYKYERGVNRIAVGLLYVVARALGVEPAYFYEGLGSGEPTRPTARQRQMIELSRNFTVLPRQQQVALAEMARALAGVEEAAA